MSSSQSVNKISESRQRYDLQDRMLQGFADHPNSTAKEICRVIGLQHEEYCDGPKRAHDLKKLGKITAGGERECRITKKLAEFYRVEDGARFAGRGKRLVVPSLVSGVVPSKPVVQVDGAAVRDRIRGLQDSIPKQGGRG